MARERRSLGRLVIRSAGIGLLTFLALMVLAAGLGGNVGPAELLVGLVVAVAVPVGIALWDRRAQRAPV
jgi:hypothetical protein